MSLKKTGRRLLASVRDARSRHVARHQPTQAEFAIADRVDFLDPAAWDAVTREAGVFLGRPFLRAFQSAGPTNVRARFALVHRGGRPVAALCAQIVRLQVSSLPKPGGKRAALARLADFESSIFVLGNLLSWGPHGVAFAPGVDPRDEWPAVAEAIERIRHADESCRGTPLILVKDVPDALAPTLTTLEPFRFRPVETEPDMVLSIPSAWRTYDDYLASLDSKYRKGARKLADETLDAGLVLERVTDLAPHAARLHELYLEVHGPQKLRLATLTPEFLPTVARELGDAFRCVVLRRDQRIVGFVTCVSSGATATGWFIGYARSESERAPVYLRLLHAVVAEAIDMGARRLSLGRTALEPKARLGARPEPLRIWVRHRIPALNPLLRRLLAVVPHVEAPERNPFKA